MSTSENPKITLVGLNPLLASVLLKELHRRYPLGSVRHVDSVGNLPPGLDAVSDVFVLGLGHGCGTCSIPDLLRVLGKDQSDRWKVIAITSALHPIVIDEAAKQGADAVLTTDNSNDEVLGQLEAVLRGEEGAVPSGARSQPWWGLSKTERLVMTWLAHGGSMEELAKQRFRTYCTISKQKLSAKAKLGLTSDAQITGYFLSQGLHLFGAAGGAEECVTG